MCRELPDRAAFGIRIQVMEVEHNWLALPADLARELRLQPLKPGGERLPCLAVALLILLPVPVVVLALPASDLLAIL